MTVSVAAFAEIQLQRVAEAAAVAPLGGNPFAVIVIQVEVARQLFAGKCLWTAVLASPLRGGQEADRHGVKAPRRRSWPA